MKGAKAMDGPSLVPSLDWEASPQSTTPCVVPRSRNSSLHLSINTRAQADTQFLQGLQHSEEHRHRLVCLGEKVGRLAHDIRNPLSSIEWFATLLGREHQSQEERQELADHCIQAIRSLDHLVSNMLVLSSPLHVQREPVDLLTLLDDVELLAMYPLRKKRLIVHRCLDGKVATIKGHESLLKQALLNLLINAIHASEPDTLIEVHCQHTSRIVGEKESQRFEKGVALHIRDHGCGMSEEELSNMFRPFYSGRKGGTGLGLQIVKQIIHIHQGLIDITSQQGKGTTVELFFPQ
jgi:signal transduction histidine kinase